MSAVDRITVDSYRDDPEHQRIADALLAHNGLTTENVYEAVRIGGAKWIVHMRRICDFAWPAPKPGDRRYLLRSELGLSGDGYVTVDAGWAS